MLPYKRFRGAMGCAAVLSLLWLGTAQSAAAESAVGDRSESDGSVSDAVTLYKAACAYRESAEKGENSGKDWQLTAEFFGRYLSRFGAENVTDDHARVRLRQALFCRGEAAFFSNQAKVAGDTLVKFCEQYPDDKLVEHALVYLGDLAQQARDVAAARSNYERALADFPNGRLAAYCREGLTRCDQMEIDLAREIKINGAEPIANIVVASTESSTHSADSHSKTPATSSTRENPSNDARSRTDSSPYSISPVPQSDPSAIHEKAADAQRTGVPPSFESATREQLQQIFEQGRMHVGPNERRHDWCEAALRLAQMDVRDDAFAAAAARVDMVLQSTPPLTLRSHGWYLAGQIAALQGDWPTVQASMGHFLELANTNASVSVAGQRVQSGEILAAQIHEAHFWIAEALYRSILYQAAASHANVIAAKDALDDVAAFGDSRWSATVALRMAQLEFKLADTAQRDHRSSAMQRARSIAMQYPGFDLQFEAEFLIGRCHAERGEYAEARAAYQNVLDHAAAQGTETAAMAQWMMGETFLHQQNFDAALVDFLRVESLHRWPAWQARGLLQAGVCYQYLGRRSLAVESYARLVSDYPRSEHAGEAIALLAKMDHGPQDNDVVTPPTEDRFSSSGAVIANQDSIRSIRR